jgi:hypothetical protein
MSRRRSSLAELERLVRILEPGTRNLGQYLAEHGEVLAPRLGIEVKDLHALANLPDEEAAPRVKELLARRADARAQRHHAALGELVTRAARRLASTAIWKGQAAVIDVGLLLTELLADSGREYIGFESSAFEVHLPRSKLVEVARVLPHQYPDIVGWVDASGLHFRWRRGRGGLNLLPQPVRPGAVAYVLTVSIPPPVREALQHAQPRHVRRLAPGTGPSAVRPSAGTRGKTGWLADILAQISLAP